MSTSAVMTTADAAGPKCRTKRRATEVQVVHHDEVGEIRARQEERGGVGKQERAIEEWRFGLSSTASGVDEDGGEEGHRRIEIQDCRHEGDEDRGGDEQGDWA